ncbi:hypothetical protein [Planobispora takensis]|uniref:Mercuric ion transport protein n=1 Tax=Planobispora takensis TaxID=1367882 RepID=A0A8J3T5J5_9ACTN|nr:hypothetical protein [Planobispora takensis]GII05300.1 hypothetical protein Pta02_73080 [Planobispora takensis]
MPTSTDPKQRRRLLPAGLAGMAALACAACCALPLLLAAGVIGGAGAVAIIDIMPTVAVVLAALAVAAWGLAWTARRRKKTSGCAGGTGCGCRGGMRRHIEVDPLQSRP